MADVGRRPNPLRSDLDPETADWLEFLRSLRDRGGAPIQSSMARQLKISPATMSRLMNSDVPGEEEMARCLLKLLGADNEELEAGLRLYRSAEEKAEKPAGSPSRDPATGNLQNITAHLGGTAQGVIGGNIINHPL